MCGTFIGGRANELNQNLTIIKPSNAPPTRDHVWGFWSDPVLNHAQSLARSTWQEWAIITGKNRAVLRSATKPYNAFKRSDWTNYCRKLAEDSNVTFVDEHNWQKSTDSLLFDTAPRSAQWMYIATFLWYRDNHT